MLESLCGVTKLDMLLTVHDVPLEGGGRGGEFTVTLVASSTNLDVVLFSECI